MNKILILMLLVLVTSFAFVGAQQSGAQQGQRMAENASHLNEIVQQKHQELEQQITQNIGEEQQLRIQNQNRVRLAVHSFLAMEDLVGGIGKNVSAIAKEFNNSLQLTAMSEEKIQKRSALTRFFAGGDEISAQEIEAEVIMNQERIQELNRLMEECDCEDEVKEMLQQQIMNLEQEQTRIQELAQNEKQSKGLLGWLWK